MTYDKEKDKTAGKYLDRDSSGNDYAGMVGMSDLHRAALDAAKESWERANAAGDRAAMDAAHDQAEAIRSQYGYSGGADGTQYIPTGQSQAQKFSYAAAPVYASKYQDQIDALTKQLLGRPAFSYDPESDPTYQQYKESYTRQGQQAMQDTLGQVAARTGGLASSYASTAAQQTYDGYMSALADKVPELRQLAYEMYMDEGDAQRANLSMLQALEDGEYNKYLSALGQYNTDRNFAYGQFADQRELDYQVSRDQIGDQRYEQEYADSRADTEWQRLNYTSEQEYERALQKAQTLAAAGDFSGYKAMGYSEGEVAMLKAAYDKAQAAITASGSKSSGGSSGSTGNGTQNYDGLFVAAWKSGRPQSFIANNYKQYGFSNSSGIWNEYQSWVEGYESGGMNKSYFQQMMNSISTGLQQGKADTLISGVESAWDRLSGAQKEELRELLGKYGYAYYEED